MNYEELLLGEDDFAPKMQELHSFRQQYYIEGSFPDSIGRELHYTHIPCTQAKASVVISHGFCEFIRKYDEAIYYFHELGYEVYFLDHLGHGNSFRWVKELDKVHAKKFDTYVDDLAHFVETVVIPKAPGEIYLFAHSMGGAIGAAVLERYPLLFQKAVLSSPMIGLYTGGKPEFLAEVICALAGLTGRSTRYVPGSHGFDHKYAFADSSTLSESRYAYMFRERKNNPYYQTYGATYGWTFAAIRGTKPIRRDASKIKIPVLLAQAGLDVKVDNQAQDAFIARVEKGMIRRYPEAKHEIFNADTPERMAFYKDILEFYEEW